MAVFDKSDDARIQRLTELRESMNKDIAKMQDALKDKTKEKAKERASEKLREVETPVGASVGEVMARMDAMDTRFSVIENLVTDVSSKAVALESKVDDIKTVVDGIAAILNGDF